MNSETRRMWTSSSPTSTHLHISPFLFPCYKKHHCNSETSLWTHMARQKKAIHHSQGFVAVCFLFRGGVDGLVCACGTWIFQNICLNQRTLQSNRHQKKCGISWPPFEFFRAICPQRFPLKKLSIYVMRMILVLAEARGELAVCLWESVWIEWEQILTLPTLLPSPLGKVVKVVYLMPTHDVDLSWISRNDVTLSSWLLSFAECWCWSPEVDHSWLDREAWTWRGCWSWAWAGLQWTWWYYASWSRPSRWDDHCLDKEWWLDRELRDAVLELHLLPRWWLIWISPMKLDSLRWLGACCLRLSDLIPLRFSFSKCWRWPSTMIPDTIV